MGWRRAAFPFVLLLAACTPRQIAFWQDRTDQVGPARAAVELAAIPTPDGPCAQWYWHAIEAGWTAHEWDTAAWVMAGESHCNPDAVGPEGEVGLMQLHRKSGWDGCEGDLYDPLTNLRCAHVVLDAQGWGAWTVWRTAQ